MPYAVLLVDEHKMLRDGIRAILEKSADDFRVVGEAGNGSDAVSLCKTLHPDLVLMDVGLPGINGVEATSEIVRHCPGTKVVILTMSGDANSVVAAFRSGVRAFLLKKKLSSADLLEALRTVARGGSYLSAEVSDHLLTRIQQGNLNVEQVSGPLDNLSSRERQVLRLIADGKSSKDIANMLDLGVQTVRTYRKRLMKKIGVTNIASLTQVAITAGLTAVGKSEPGEPSAGPKQ
jgi:DNA-binding NarL/FixJ family response regulator